MTFAVRVGAIAMLTLAAGGAAQLVVAQTAANPSAQTVAAAAGPTFTTLPAGTPISVRLTNEINSKNAKAGDTFHGTTASAMTAGGRTVIATGTPVTGMVLAAKSGGRLRGAAELSLQLVSVRLQSAERLEEVTVATDPLANLGSGKGGSTAVRTGGGAALGGLLGAVTGGATGAVVGAAGGGAVGAGSSGMTSGKQIDLKPEQLLQFRMSMALDVPMPQAGTAPGAETLQTRPTPR